MRVEQDVQIQALLSSLSIPQRIRFMCKYARLYVKHKEKQKARIKAQWKVQAEKRKQKRSTQTEG